jgi:hypothetical protein
MVDVRAIVVPFNSGENFLSSTLWKTAKLLWNSLFLPDFNRKDSVAEVAIQRAEKY